MQRKHYNAIAAALRSGKAQVHLVYSIADANSKFDTDKFVLKATDGPSMEQRAAKYRTHLKSMDRWREEANRRRMASQGLTLP